MTVKKKEIQPEETTDLFTDTIKKADEVVEFTIAICDQRIENYNRVITSLNTRIQKEETDKAVWEARKASALAIESAE